MRLPTLLSKRRPNAHKGDFGHVFILAGSARFSGAAVLCSEGALRAGAGLVTLGIPKSLNTAIIKIKPKEVMTLPLPETGEATLSLNGYKKIEGFIEDNTVLVIGPGLGCNKSTQNLVRKLVREVKRPMVVDADGLNALAGHLYSVIVSRCQSVRDIIMTPHPGEMANLLGISVKKVQSNREDVARKFSRKYNCTVVLKGHKTVVADRDGKIYLNNTGNPGMATAGSGDVLSGIIAAFLGQGLGAFKAARYAVYLHGLAGDLAAEEKTQLSLIASDIIDKIPQAIKRCG